jgi:hypothetical protein
MLSNFVQKLFTNTIKKLKQKGDFKMKNQIFKSAAVKVTTAVLFVLLSFISASAQYYVNTYDTKCGATSGSDYGRAIINRIDSGYAISGFSYNPACGIGPYDWMFIKVKPNGANDFVKLLGTPADDKCYSLIQSSVDSGYVLAGYMYHQATAQKRATLVKLDKFGNLMYTKFIYDSLGSSYSQIVNDPSNTRGLAGYDERYISTKARTKMLVSQYDAAGNKNWAYRYDAYSTILTASASQEEASTLCYQPASNTYGVAAKTNFYSGAAGQWDILVMNVSYAGAVNWKKVFRFNINLNYYPSAEPKKIIPMSDGGFVIVGSTNAYVQAESDIIVFRINAAGGLMWSCTYGNTGSSEFGNSIVLDGGYLTIAGYRKGNAPTTDALLMKIPVAGGAAVWTRLWDPTNPNEAGYDLVRSNIGAPDGYAVTGDASFNSYDAFLWRNNVNGLISGAGCNNTLAVQFINNNIKLDSFIIRKVAIDDKSINPVIINPMMNTNILCSSDSFNESGTEEDNTGSGEVTDYALSQNYPNPFNPSTTIKFDIPVSGYVSVKVFDIAGKEVYSLVNEVKSAGSHKIVFNATGIPSGVYYYKIISGNFSDIKKMILIK